MMRLFALTSIVVCLNGCATYYVAPEGVPSATLGIVTDMRPVMVYRFDDKECSPSTQGNRLLFVDPTFHPDSKNSGPLKIEANRELVMTFHKSYLANFGSDRSSCDITIRLTPKPNNYYEASFKEDKERGGCLLNLFRAEMDSTGKRTLVAETAFVRNEKKCTSGQ